MILFSTGTLGAEKILYDDFSTGYLDGEKWRQRNYVLEIVGGQLVSKIGNRSPGMSAEVLPGIFRNHLPFAPPTPTAPETLDDIKIIECEITIVEAIRDNAPDSRSGAMIFGYFYNKNGTGSAIGDILALLAIGDRGNGGLEAYWVAVEALTDDAQTEGFLDGDTILGPGPLQYGTPYKLKISYDGDKRFDFSIFVGSTEYTDFFIGPDKNGIAITSLKSISTGIDATNGSNNGFVSAKIDNVHINDEGTVYDDFSDPLIDLTNWRWDEWVREPSNGYLRANIIGNGSTEWVNTSLIEKDAPYLEAKVYIDSSSQLSPGAVGVGRVQGYFYNESRGPGSGQAYNEYEGNVFVQLQLNYNSDGSLIAKAYADRSNNENQNDWTNLFSHDFSVPIALDTFYTLSIKFEGKKLIFNCAGESVEHNITTPTYPAYDEYRSIQTRLYLDSGETGYMKVRFDDIYIEKKVMFNPSVPVLLLF